MEWLCSSLSSTTTAAWVEAIGTILAAATAAVVYARGRYDQRRDLIARRKVLHAVVSEHIRHLAGNAHRAFSTLADLNRFVQAEDIEDEMRKLSLGDTDRIFSLQSDLINFGEAGDAELAVFIEKCRAYEHTYNAIRVKDRDFNRWHREAAFHVLRSHLLPIVEVAKATMDILHPGYWQELAGPNIVSPVD